MPDPAPHRSGIGADHPGTDKHCHQGAHRIDALIQPLNDIAPVRRLIGGFLQTLNNGQEGDEAQGDP